MKSEVPVFRFAPSPNGELHLGHAYSALLNLELARRNNGKVLLRIEDIDTVRCTPEHEKQLLVDLEWIGFEWDGEPLRQSLRFDAYHEALAELRTSRLIYPAIWSRSRIKHFVADYEEDGSKWPRDPDGSPHYPGKERNLSVTEQDELISSEGNHALRLDMKTAVSRIDENLSWDENGYRVSSSPMIWGDAVLARMDTPTSYHLSCVLDDAYQGITNIVRGMDLYESTSLQRLLQKLLNLPEPMYFHHKLITDIDGQKLSKSNKDTSLRQLREAGKTAEEIRLMLFGDAR